MASVILCMAFYRRGSLCIIEVLPGTVVLVSFT